MSNEIKSIELGYTITDCYSGNANWGHAQQKQYVVMIDGELKSLFLKGFVNVPADAGRERTYHKIDDLSIEQYNELKRISDNHKEINWNTGRYSVYTDLLNKKDYAEIKKAEQDYINTLVRICEPVNRKAQEATKKALIKFIKPFLPKEDFDTCERFIWIF